MSEAASCMWHCQFKYATCHISKQRMLQLSSHHIRTILTVRPEEAQDAYHQADSHCRHTSR